SFHTPRKSCRNRWFEENGPARRACRDGGENSNACAVRTSIGSGIIAAFRSLTGEIFSVDFARSEGYFGANPNARSNRLAYAGHTLGLTIRGGRLPSSASRICSAAIRPILT